MCRRKTAISGGRREGNVVSQCVRSPGACTCDSGGRSIGASLSCGYHFGPKISHPYKAGVEASPTGLRRNGKAHSEEQSVAPQRARSRDETNFVQPAAKRYVGPECT